MPESVKDRRESSPSKTQMTPSQWATVRRSLALLLLVLLLMFALPACQGTDEEDQTAAVASTVSVPAATETSPAQATDTAAPEPTSEPAQTEVAPISDATTTGPAASDQVTTDTPAPVTPTPKPTDEPVGAPASQVSLELVTGGLTRPLYLTHAYDDRLFVVEQAGRIQIVADGQLQSEPFLDISDRVGSTALEQGLLSVAFHPDYPQNGRFFVDYTDRQGNTVIASYQVDSGDPDRADSGSEQVLLTVAQPFPNHNGGQLHFGPDGYLYVGMGDGGGAGDTLNNGQNPDSLLGTLLRLDVDGGEPYGIPADNPYAESDDGLAEIWATGLRNPWRFSFDRQSGDLYVADVGQNLWEEVNFLPAGTGGGANYGWNVLEASHCFGSGDCDATGYVAPVAEYAHQGGHCSITGGYVYRGIQHPELNGNYYFADYCSGSIWSLFRQPDGSWLQQPLQRTGMVISSFGEDNRGELYVLDHVNGEVYQIGP